MYVYRLYIGFMCLFVYFYISFTCTFHSLSKFEFAADITLIVMLMMKNQDDSDFKLANNVAENDMR